MSYYDESYTNPRKRRPAAPKYRKPAPAVRKPARPKTAAERARERQLELAQAWEEMRIAEEAKREGNYRVAGMIMETVRGRLDFVEGRKSPRSRGLAQRPGTVDTELRNTRRRLNLIQAMQN